MCPSGILRHVKEKAPVVEPTRLQAPAHKKIPVNLTRSVESIPGTWVLLDTSSTRGRERPTFIDRQRSNRSRSAIV
jgi:hypothetical protein